MIIPDHFYRVSIKALILDENKRFMLVKEDNGTWELPGGGLDYGENPQDCLKREIKEEMGIETIFIGKTPVYFLTSKHDGKGHWFVNVIYETKLKNLNFTKSNECIDLKFFTKDEALKENLFSNVTDFVNMYNPNNH